MICNIEVITNIDIQDTCSNNEIDNLSKIFSNIIFDTILINNISKKNSIKDLKIENENIKLLSEMSYLDVSKINSKFDSPIIKMSKDNCNKSLLSKASKLKKSVVISIGSESIASIKEFLPMFCSNNKLTILYCETEDDVKKGNSFKNLKKLLAICRCRPNTSIGYKSFSNNYLYSVIAVALGATTIQYDIVVSKASFNDEINKYIKLLEYIKKIPNWKV